MLLLQAPDGGFCTGSLVAPDVVLTAAHCQLAAGWTAHVMSGDEPVASQEVIEAVFHRYHDGGDAFADHDISLARLAGPLPAEPVPFATAPLEANPAGDTLVVVGFGVDNGFELTGGGVKRVAGLPITLVADDYVQAERRATSICYGDSGGPAFLSIDGVLTVFGVTRSLFGPCTGASQFTRVDTYAVDFVLPYVDSWSGPCPWDETCTTDGCRTPDPDCAPCGVDGICSTGCPTVDLDCPRAGNFGDACSSREDCESLLCVDGEDGERFCTETCDDVDRFCPAGYVCQASEEARTCMVDAGDDQGGCGVAGRHTSSRRPGFAFLLALALSCLACSRGPRRRRRCPGTA